VDFSVTFDGDITIKPQGLEDGWQITVIESGPTMERFELATQRGCKPQLSRRFFGSRHTDNWDWKLATLPSTDNAGWVRRVVALAKRRSLTHGTEAA
jgi:hypothetical protein